ncbi:relaxase/mobilization nuclease domain-containing protein [Maribacter polysaccharolyticus]|uniref:relaxase/mobilization nuclease domain-containing protein n=1 Tax=Maribacter polysaccharolyticus TaxID=3020831 RepID=UPI00237F13B1|nr:relaxase/mobilization nuclease domain-containing protein [Maribacter polysaccharolyticus]MDE3740216.1 relaxase/mobilization nuclease domain-containing protein [Maribacter polysaccharolyticus]
MIGKGKSISHTRASMSYGWNQEKDAEIVLKEFLHGDSPAEITKEFKMLQDQNYHCTKNTLSFVISPTIEDGKRLDKNELQAITKRFMHEMKLGERQAIAFVHQDKDHKHIHLYVNRIDFKGIAYNDSFIGKRSQLAAEKTAEHLGLTTVKQIQFEKEFNLNEIRTEIKRRHDLTMKQFKPKSFDAYIKDMQVNGVKVIPTINNQKKLQGFRFEFDGHNLKGSEVHRNMSIGNIGKQMAGIEGAKVLKNNNVTIKIADKLVDLTPNLALKITKFIIKKAIDKGISY